MGHSLKPDQIRDTFSSVPGFRAELLGSTTLPASSYNAPAGWSQILPWPGTPPGGTGEPSETFVVPSDGRYRVKLYARHYIITANDYVKYKVVFDENEASQQQIGDSIFWTVESFLGTFQHVTLEEELTLTVGAHTAKVYGYCPTADRWRHVTPTNGLAQPPKLVIESVTGSGAPGSKTTRGEAASNVDLTANDTWVTITSVTVDSGDETVDVDLSGFAYPPTAVANGFYDVAVFVDSETSPRKAVRDKLTQTDDNRAIAMSARIDLTRGQHTIYFKATKRFSSADTRVAGGTGDPVAAKIEVTQYRGNLIPVYDKNGTLIHDAPDSWKLGEGLIPTNVDGQVVVNADYPTGGIDDDSAELVSLASAFSPSAATTWEDVDNGGGDALEKTISCRVGEWVLLNCNCQLLSNSNVTETYVRFEVDGVAVAIDGGDIPAAVAPNANLYTSFTAPFRATAEQHVVKVQMWSSLATTELRTDEAGQGLSVIKFQGGYSQPDNVPRLEYNSASVINVVAAPGTSDVLRLALSDGIKYTASSPLSVDLTASGLGGLDTGSEAVSTWYFVYAVKSATLGEFGVVASVTAPGSGGPTGYDAWKYLGVVRNDGSGDILAFRHIEYNRFSYETRQNVETDATIESDVAVSCSHVVPVTASMGLFIANAYQFGTGYNACSYYTSIGGVQAASPIATMDVNECNNNISMDIPMDEDQQYFKRVTAAGGASSIGTQTVNAVGWIDKWLSGGDTQKQAAYVPDTKSPRGVWQTGTTVDFSARPGQAATTRLTLQDGKQRTFSGTLNWSDANNEADLGWDESASQAAGDKFIFFYAVPSSGNDDVLTVRASDNLPSVGPTGYSNWKLIWAAYRESGSLVRAIQAGNTFFYTTRGDAEEYLQSTPGNDASVQSLSLTYVPETAGEVIMMPQVTAGNIILYVDGVTSDHIGFENADVATDTGFYGAGKFPMPVSHCSGARKIGYRRDGTPSAARILTSGWRDEWIDS